MMLDSLDRESVLRVLQEMMELWNETDTIEYLLDTQVVMVVFDDRVRLIIGCWGSQDGDDFIDHFQDFTGENQFEQLKEKLGDIKLFAAEGGRA